MSTCESAYVRGHSGTLAQATCPAPGRDRCSAPLFGLYIADSLGQLPVVSPHVLDDARALAVLPRRHSLHDLRAMPAGAGKCRIDIGHAHLDQMRPAIALRSHPLAADIDDHNGPVHTDPHLSTV